MRVARIHEWGSAPRLDNVPEPTRADGEVLVDVRAAGLAHLDLSVASGTFGMHPELPYVGGIEGSGVVVEADDLTTGTHVLIRGGGVGLLRDGTWAQRVSVPRKAVRPVPTELPPAVAATFYQPTSTAYVTLHDVAGVQPGERVVVVGAAGAVGGQVVQQALGAGADVVGVVGSAARLAAVPAGAVAIARDDTTAIDQLAKDRAATLLVDTVGGPGLAACLRWVAPGGRAAVVGYTAGTETTLDLPSWLLDDVALLPVNMIRKEHRARELVDDLLARLVAGELTVAVETFAFADIVAGLDALRAGRVTGRAAVLMAETL